MAADSGISDALLNELLNVFNALIHDGVHIMPTGGDRLQDFMKRFTKQKKGPYTPEQWRFLATNANAKLKERNPEPFERQKAIFKYQVKGGFEVVNCHNFKGHHSLNNTFQQRRVPDCQEPVAAARPAALAALTFTAATRPAPTPAPWRDMTTVAKAAAWAGMHSQAPATDGELASAAVTPEAPPPPPPPKAPPLPLRPSVQRLDPQAPTSCGAYSSSDAPTLPLPKAAPVATQLLGTEPVALGPVPPPPSRSPPPPPPPAPRGLPAERLASRHLQAEVPATSADIAPAALRATRPPSPPLPLSSALAAPGDREDPALAEYVEHLKEQLVEARGKVQKLSDDNKRLGDENQCLRKRDREREQKLSRIQRALVDVANDIEMEVDERRDVPCRSQSDFVVDKAEVAADVRDSDGNSEPEMTGSTVSTQANIETVWPPCLKIQELLDLGSPDELACLAPLCRQMKFINKVDVGMLIGILNNHDVEVADVWVGLCTDRVTPLATVAFGTKQDVQRAMYLEIQQQLGNFLGVVEISSWQPWSRGSNSWVGQRRVWFKNYYNVPLTLQQVQGLAMRFSDGEAVSVEVSRYLDARQKKPVDEPTDIILCGSMEFAREVHADALVAALVEDPVDHFSGEVRTVLKWIPGVPAPIAFERDTGYVEAVEDSDS